MTQKHIQAKASMLCKTKQNQRYSSIKKKKHHLGAPFPLFEFSPPLENCSDIYLIITLLFNVLFLWYSPLMFICHLSLSVQDTPPYCWLATSVFCDSVSVSRMLKERRAGLMNIMKPWSILCLPMVSFVETVRGTDRVTMNLGGFPSPQCNLRACTD